MWLLVLILYRQRRSSPKLRKFKINNVLTDKPGKRNRKMPARTSSTKEGECRLLYKPCLNWTQFFFLPSWMMNFQTLIWSNLYSVTVWCFICWTVLWPAIKSLSIGSNTLTGLQIIFVSWKDLCPAKSLFCLNRTNMWWDTKNKKAKSEQRVIQINYVTTFEKKNVCYLY